MNAGPQKQSANLAGSGLASRSNVEFDLESLLLRPAAAEFYQLSTGEQQSVDVFGFVHRKPEFTPQQCVDALLTDQHQRYGNDNALPAETYCAFLSTGPANKGLIFEGQGRAGKMLDC